MKINDIFIWEWNKTTIQWPCDNGFHIPSETERTNLGSIVSVFATIEEFLDWGFIEDYLYVPIWAWYIDHNWTYYSWTSITGMTSMSYYWTYNIWIDNINYVKANVFKGSFNKWISEEPRAFAAFIRAFKNTPEVPDNTWTTLYDGSSVAQWAWIFYKSLLWLISISGDWTNWITIQDKNVWATTPYTDYHNNYTQAYVGKLFQWWNNHWFDWATPSSTSSTLIDASSYWPWNYYDSATFITNATDPSDWSSVKNDDLWWNDTWVHNLSDIEIYIWPWRTDNLYMQWPSPTWYHIPNFLELQSLLTIMTDLWIDTSDYSCMKTYIKAPPAWNRVYSNGNASHGSGWVFWSTSVTSTNVIYLIYNSYYCAIESQPSRAMGYSIRCFKNTPEVPTWSWATLYDWSSVAQWAWIFHDSTSWLISLSKDWINWVTIQDKNLGATVVYNDWDTLSQSNCWYYYQRWNNYGFDWNWSITTSYTQVDASGYWPWNYYSDSTFRIGHNDWSSVVNDNLRWWVFLPNAEAVYVWTTQVYGEV